MNRPDFSNYLAHFTTNRQPCSKAKENPTIDQKGVSAIDRLINILTIKEIFASRLSWNNLNAVCLTECPWGSLLAHAKNYSPYGIGFTKDFIFNKDGSPVFYVRPDIFDKQKWTNETLIFTTPFWPEYRLTKSYKKFYKTLDYSHEREWRVPTSLKFEYTDIQFIVLKSYKDIGKISDTLIAKIGKEKFLLMENYQYIEKLWPHLKIET